jgi:hypothetical protein
MRVRTAMVFYLIFLAISAQADESSCPIAAVLNTYGLDQDVKLYSKTTKPTTVFRITVNQRFGVAGCDLVAPEKTKNQAIADDDLPYTFSAMGVENTWSFTNCGKIVQVSYSIRDDALPSCTFTFEP